MILSGGEKELKNRLAVVTGVSIATIVLLAVSPMMVNAAATATPQAPLIDMEFRAAEVLDIYQVLGDLAGLNVVADQSVRGKFSIVLRSTPLTQALELVAQSTGFGYTLVGNTLVVASPERLRSFAQRDFTLLPVRHLAPETAKSLLEASLPGLAVTLDQRQAVVLISGTKEQVEEARSILGKYDTPPVAEYDFVDQSVAEILRALAKSAGINVVVEGNMTAKLTIYLRAMPAREAIDLVASRAGVVQEETPEGVLVLRPEGTKATLVAPARSELVRVKYLPVATAAEVVSAAFPTLEVNTITSESALIVRGLAGDVAAGREFLEQQDFPDIRLAGLVQHETGWRAVLEIAGRSYTVQSGQTIGGDLVIESLAPEGVTVRKGRRTELITTGGALR